jgi:type IV pilus assembly protein PilB
MSNNSSSAKSATVTPVVPPIANKAELLAAFARPRPRVVKREAIGAMLMNDGWATASGVHRALSRQKDEPEMRLGELLLSAGRISEQALYAALGEQLGVLYVRLGEFDVDPEALLVLSQELARRYEVLPLAIVDGRLVIAMSDPADLELVTSLRFAARCQIEPVLASPQEIKVAIATHYPPFDDVALQAEADRLHVKPDAAADARHIERLAQEPPVVRLVANLLQDAVHRRASDIHVRARERSAEVLYRIDGSLVTIRAFSLVLLPAIVARIKVIAGMNLAEHRLPQDGSIHFDVNGQPIDLRISIMPATHGESVVIRILDRNTALRKLGDVGFTQSDEIRFRGLIDRNQGLVLVTGPTGSGKTTTLYAALQELNTGEYNIVTVEDPVEYQLDHVVQIQVQTAIDYTFAKALRHILRHDPDVILIGEIRDAETAKIAVESALTGHLVLSTVHTNSAAQTITRLIEIGIQPYLVNATVAGVLAQRLVRRNCSKCKAVETVGANILESLHVSADEKFYRGKGCEECNGTGYRGRIAVYELLELTPALRELIHNNASHDAIEAGAIREGMVPLTSQALALARNGVISMQEVYRARL